MRRKLGCLAALASAAVALLVGLTFIEIDSPALGRALLARAGTATGATIEAGEFRLSILRGLSLKRVRASGTADGDRYEVTLDRLVFEHRLLPLLTGRIWVDKVRLDRPRVRLFEGGGRPVAKKPKAAAPSPTIPLAVHVSEIVIRDGAAETPSRRVRDIQGTLAVAEGRLVARELRFRTDEGPFRIGATADLGRAPLTYDLELDGTPLDLNVVSGLTGRGGRFGPAHLQLKARGEGTEPRDLAGEGRLELGAGTLPATPLLSSIESTLGRTRIVGAPYKATATAFRIERGRVTLEGLRLEATTVGLDLSGSATLDGGLDLGVAVRAPRDQVQIAEVPAELIDALADEAGWVRVPLRVTGTRLHPRVVPDLSALGAQARQGGVRVLEKKAVGRLRRLLGGD